MVLVVWWWSWCWWWCFVRGNGGGGGGASWWCTRVVMVVRACACVGERRGRGKLGLDDVVREGGHAQARVDIGGVVATDPEERFLGDVHLRGSDVSVGDRPEGRSWWAPTQRSPLLVIFVYVGTTFVSATDQGAHVGEHRPTWVSLRAQKRGASPWGSSDERSVASAAEPLGQQFRRA